MNIAMTLYSKHFQGNKSETKLEEFEDYIEGNISAYLVFLPNGHKQYSFSDKSKLIFTHDNVQVSLF